jgi:protein-S-isoprenylcysteine O-methyltransferase Ste14
LTLLHRVLIAAWVAFPVSEIVLAAAKRARTVATATAKDRGSRALLWAAIAVGVTAGSVVRWTLPGSMRVPEAAYEIAGLALMASGLALRWTAILSLGRFFTTDVAVHAGHRVVRDGVYRLVRHPAYTGLLVAFLGLGVSFGHWLSLAVVMVPLAAALAYRIRVEEAALLERLGSEYAEYCRVTKRLIPGVY